MGINEIVKIIDDLNENSRLLSEVTDITKRILAKDPAALDNGAAENVIKSHFGESMYIKVQKIYHDLIGT